MKAGWGWLIVAAASTVLLTTACEERAVEAITVPVTLDHNRMLVDAQMQRADGSWRPVRLWVDSGNPDFFLSPELARDLGMDLSARDSTAGGTFQSLEVEPPRGLRIGDLPLTLAGIKTTVMFQPGWLFSTMHNDANLPATVLRHYQVVFDYPGRHLTIAVPGQLQPRGTAVEASVHPATGIVQIDALIAGDSLSLALDNGASYSFVSDDILIRLSERHPTWPQRSGAVGCANIWGWWPGEDRWPILRVPELAVGPARLRGIGVAGLPPFFPNGMDLGSWYSLKAARPVAGFLGPNALQGYRVTIDYAKGAVYLEPVEAPDAHDMDLVGLTLRPQADGSYLVIGVANQEDILPGDTLLRVGDLEATGATMGTVVDALRGAPGDVRRLVLERDGQQITIEATVARQLRDS